MLLAGVTVAAGGHLLDGASVGAFARHDAVATSGASTATDNNNPSHFTAHFNAPSPQRIFARK